MDEQIARHQLEELEISYTKESYLDAVQNGKVNLVALFIKAGMPVDVDISKNVNWNETALMIAAEHGHQSVVEWLISAGADVNAQTYENITALMQAAENGNLKIVELLIQAGADIRINSRFGWTALLYAVGQNRLKIAELLIALGSDIDRKGGGIGGYITTPLERAALCGYFEMLKLLIKAGATVSNENIRTLEMAVLGGHLEIVKYLVANGSDVNARSDKSHPLGAASEYGYLEIIRFLLANGADINLKSRKTLQTALIKAAKCGQSEIVKFLIEAGAELDEEDHEGWTALMFAKMFTKYNQETDVLNQFPNPNPQPENYLERFTLYWNKRLLLPICPNCLVPFQMRFSEEGEMSVFHCPMEGKNYYAMFFDGTPLTLSEAQQLVADIIEPDSEQ